ncbi:polysaccharide deacetylase family protein [Rhizobiaceae bacterium BDR2-2]|uniref:Polysaccharide deacetylase family protein n=1 Tax=Ectorhizobium quercum TaxID=2965071 RepID=A0AAE3SU35_9HYPH|nr:polysaccharide deacetylase family protein [Ectorhizobium quercum]MCX8996637.1 polysaccharide deacetylase family protein [Ectorhizobium quercum]
MFRIARLLARLAATLPLGLLTPLPAAAQDKPKQLVLVSFDGAGPSAMWQWSRDLARRSGAHFTYFLSCTMILDRDSGKSYKGPGMKAGRSNIGFAPDKQEAAARLGHIWNAVQEGNEIGSHTCGHFDGGKWSAAEWRSEFTAFRSVLENAWTTADAAGREPEGWREFVGTRIRGFRAPYLSESPGLLPALKAEGFTYDASGVTKGPQMPHRREGLVRFGLPLIPEGPKARPVIAMDYNLYVRHSGAKEDRAGAPAFEERAYAAFRAAFDTEYDGDRTPLQLGFHFTEMNGGAYWRALERIATEVCRKPDVACVTYSEAIRSLEENRKDGIINAGL